MNSRKFPRTANEAFPIGAEYGCAIERPARHAGDLAVSIALRVAALYLASLFLWEWLA